MIGKLKGTLDEIDGNRLILDVGGVGYLVSVSATTLRQIGGVGSFAALFIETIVREDAISLFGFASAEERAAFRLLTTVQGVGAKSALAILGVLPPEQLAAALAAQDKASLARAEGVGPKLALRIVTELKDKTASIGAVFLPKGPGLASSALAGGGLLEDATSALLNLGYKRMEAFAAVTRAAARGDREKDGAGGLSALIRAALAELSHPETGASREETL